MRLQELTDTFERKLTFSMSQQNHEDFKQTILEESERVYFGEPADEVNTVAFVVQPNKVLSERILAGGYDTVLSHHRWCHRDNGAPKLGQLDSIMKKGGIKMLSYHLCWDICDDGIADMIMQKVFQLTTWNASPLLYKGREVSGLARWAEVNLTFNQVRRALTDNYIRTERYLGHLDCNFDQLIVIPGGGLTNEILSSIPEQVPHNPGGNTLVLSSGSGMASKDHYLEFFNAHEADFSILDVNHYDMEAIGVSHWANTLNAELTSAQCTMLYADHYINYSI